MGRRIPGKKHRGVKDPLRQQEQRLEKIKHKINAKPTFSDAQEIPRKLHRIAKFNKNAKCMTLPMRKKKRNKKKDKRLIDGRKYVDRERDEPGMTRPTKMVPLLLQHPIETDKKFLKRVDRVTKEILKEAAFEDKFQVEVRRNEQGQVMSIAHREKIDPLLTDKQKQTLVEREEKKRMARRERDMRRRGKKKKNNDDDDDEFSYYQDKFEFGEVVYEPPSLDTEKLTRKISGSNKSKSFLFMDKLKGKEDGNAVSTSTKKAKKEQVSAGRKRILEEERQRVNEAYRAMKAAKQHPSL